jgi:uncharacterized glyoxalase superfamily protein PhnB
MALINPYIHFNGNTEEALTFYKSVSGGEFENISRYVAGYLNEKDIHYFARIS